MFHQMLVCPQSDKPLWEDLSRRTVVESPNNQYRVEITPLVCIEDQQLPCSRRVRVFHDAQLVAAVDRGDGYGFELTWSLDHPDGHDYVFFVGGFEEQTFAQLDTGAQQVLYRQRPEVNSWRWYAMTISPCKSMAAIIISTCSGYGGSEELHIFDISTPMSAEPHTLFQFGGCGEEPGIASWQDDGTMLFSHIEERTPLFGDKLEDDLTEEEVKKLSKARHVEGWAGPLYYERRVERRWHRDTGLGPVDPAVWTPGR